MEHAYAVTAFELNWGLPNKRGRVMEPARPLAAETARGENDALDKPFPTDRKLCGSYIVQANGTLSQRKTVLGWYQEEAQSIDAYNFARTKLNHAIGR